MEMQERGEGNVRKRGGLAVTVHGMGWEKSPRSRISMRERTCISQLCCLFTPFAMHTHLNIISPTDLVPEFPYGNALVFRSPAASSPHLTCTLTSISFLPRNSFPNFHSGTHSYFAALLPLRSLSLWPVSGPSHSRDRPVSLPPRREDLRSLCALVKRQQSCPIQVRSRMEIRERGGGADQHAG
jgi:hypothetical protein